MYIQGSHLKVSHLGAMDTQGVKLLNDYQGCHGTQGSHF